MRDSVCDEPKRSRIAAQCERKKTSDGYIGKADSDAWL